MLQAIDAASRYVLLEMYLVRSGAIATRFIEAFAQAARRGARVCLVFDAFGALGLTRADRRRLLNAGVELRFFNPLRASNRLSNLLRDHRKLLLTDGSVAFVGGAGLTDDFAPGAPRGMWRELMVEIEGPVISDWQRAFARTWPPTCMTIWAPGSPRSRSSLKSPGRTGTGRTWRWWRSARASCAAAWTTSSGRWTRNATTWKS